jgi:ribosomal protein S18 acetylase RimI-like enzyme
MLEPPDMQNAATPSSPSPPLTSCADAFSIRPAGPADAPILADLMSEAIAWGRLRGLGPRFNRLLHQHLIASAYAACYVATRDGEIIAYAAAVTDGPKFNRDFLLRRGLQAVLLLIPRLLQRQHFATILRGLTYFRDSPPDDPGADIVSVAVKPHARNSGLGLLVVRALLDDLAARGIRRIKVGSVEVTNAAANRLYRRLGFRLARTVPFYEDSAVNVYIYEA